MFASPLTLSIDSFFAAFLLSGALPPRHYARLAALFGACDMAASALAPALNAHLMVAGASAAALSVLCGALVLSGGADAALTRNSDRIVYLLPALFAVDNLLVPGVTPWLAGLASTVMAAGGFGLGAVTARRLVGSTHRHRWLGVSFIACGLLLTF